MIFKNTYSPLCKRNTYGSYTDDNGLLKLAQPYEVRPTFDSNKKLNGYMSEIASNNISASSQLMSGTGSQVKSVNSTPVSNVIGPDGTYNDVQLLPYNTSGFANINTTVYPLSFISTQLWIVSFYAKAIDQYSALMCWNSWGCPNSWPRYGINVYSQTVTQNDYNGGVIPFNNGWARYYYSTSYYICNQTSDCWFYIGNASSSSNQSGVYISHMQVEYFDKNTITAPTSWIPYSSTRSVG